MKKKYRVCVPYCFIVEHIIEVDPDNMPKQAISWLETDPKRHATIIAQSKDPEEGKIVEEFQIWNDTGFIYTTTEEIE